MKKLQASSKDATERFDETLKKLFEKKIKCEMAIYQVSQHTHACLSILVMILIDIINTLVHNPNFSLHN